MLSTQRSMVDSRVSRRALAAVKRGSRNDLIAQVAFAAFLFLVFIGLEPFASHDASEAMMIATGDGDLLRQVCYVIAFVVIVSLAFAIRGQMTLTAFPVFLTVVLVWCLISVGWSVDPSIALRRLLLCVILVSCVMCGVDTLGTQRTLRVLRFVMAVILIVNCISVLIIPTAIHMAGEFEGDLAGSWRGMHYHKNIAGPIAALTALLFFHYGLAMRRLIDWVLFFAAVVFLVGTRSKTAIGFFVVALVIATLYRQMCRTPVGRLLFRFLLSAVLVFSAITWLSAYDTIADFMSDPTGFTGRVTIWQTEFLYLRDHWLLGAGFGSFWQIGEASPSLSVAAEDWLKLVPHSHNGYLEILVTTGAIGLFLSTIAFVIMPLVQILGARPSDIELNSLLLSFFSFIVFSNLLETIFLNRDLPIWVVFLIVLAILHQSPAKRIGAARP